MKKNKNEHFQGRVASVIQLAWHICGDEEWRRVWRGSLEVKFVAL